MAMHWEDIVSDEPARTWRGLAVRVDAPRRNAAALQIQAAPPRMLRVSLHGKAVLWSRIAQDYCDYEYLISRASWQNFPGIIALIPFAEVHARSQLSQEQRTPSWARYFATSLFTHDMLRLRGDVIIAAASSFVGARTHAVANRVQVPTVAFWSQLLDQPQNDLCNWDFGDDLPALSLRCPKIVDSGRVKAWRKLVQTDELPPVLVWWISGLDRYVIVDGVHRAVAALEEGVAPPCLAIASWGPARRAAMAPHDQQNLMQGLEQAIAAAATLPESMHRNRLRVEDANRMLVEAHDTRERAFLRTTAWPIPNGRDTWVREVRQELAINKISDSDMLEGFDG